MYNETTGYVICRTARKIHQYMTKLLAEHNITPEQWVVLQIVANEENLSQQELSCRLEKDKNSTKALVDRLLKKELLSREKDSTDKRLYQLKATQAGHELAQTIAAQDDDFIHNIELELSSQELNTLRQLLGRLESSITKRL